MMGSFALRQSDLLRFLQGGNVRYAIIAVNLLLVVWIAGQLAALTWSMLAPEDESLVAEISPAERSVQPGREDRLIRQLPDWHLMGVVQKEDMPVKVEVPADAPDTRLQLTLRGALASDDPGGARAIIADARGKDEQYSIGDTLPGNAELSEIYPDRVILKRNGRYETLRLPQESQSSPGRTGMRTIQTSGGSPRERLAAVRQQLQSDPRKLRGMLRASVHKDADGNMLGYAIAPGRDPEMFAELGLVEGDVVIQVDDMVLSDPKNGARALQLLRSGESVSVTLLRAGQEQVVTLEGL